MCTLFQLCVSGLCAIVDKEGEHTPGNDVFLASVFQVEEIWKTGLTDNLKEAAKCANAGAAKLNVIRYFKKELEVNDDEIKGLLYNLRKDVAKVKGIHRNVIATVRIQEETHQKFINSLGMFPDARVI